MVSASEFARLVVAFSVLPLLWRVSLDLRFEKDDRVAYAVVFGAIYASYVLTIVEGLIAPDFVNALQHLCFGIAGIASVITASRLKSRVIEKGRPR